MIPAYITLEMMRQALYTAVVCDVLDSLGFPRQSPPRVAPAPFRRRGADRPGKNDPLDGNGRARPFPVRIGTAGRRRVPAGRRAHCRRRWIDPFRHLGRAVIDRRTKPRLPRRDRRRGVRDVAKMREMRFPVFARATSPYDSKDRQRVTAIDVPVEIAGVTFHPGEIVIADIDGVAVIPRSVETEVIRRAWQQSPRRERGPIGHPTWDEGDRSLSAVWSSLSLCW